MKITDTFVLIYLGISFPIFVIIMVAILLAGGASDNISYNEAFKAIQGVMPVLIAYVSAILGFSFNNNPSLSFSNKSRSKISIAQNTIRVWISLSIPTALMLFDLILSIFFAVGNMKLDDYMVSMAILTWSLTGIVGYIFGKYFGEK